MLKKGVLSTAEKFYIESHSGLEPEQIAKSLNRNTETIIKYLKKVKSFNKKKNEEQVNSEPEEKETKKIKGRVSEMMARHKGAVVMTPNASELSDKNMKNNLNKNMDNIIFKPMGNKK